MNSFSGMVLEAGGLCVSLVAHPRLHPTLLLSGNPSDAAHLLLSAELLHLEDAKHMGLSRTK